MDYSLHMAVAQAARRPGSAERSAELRASLLRPAHPQCHVGIVRNHPTRYKCNAAQDLDVDMRLALAKGAHVALLKQIQVDAALLARMGVMDYSLLLGVHYPKWGDNTWFPPAGNHTVSISLAA